MHSREIIRHVLVMPELGGGAAGLFFNYNIMFGNNYMDYYVTVHETSHGLDYGGADESPLHDSQGWFDAYGQDSASPTEYAMTTWAEAFAEVGPLAFYDKYVEGGLAAIQPSISQVSLFLLRAIAFRTPWNFVLTAGHRSKTSSTSSRRSSTTESLSAAPARAACPPTMPSP